MKAQKSIRIVKAGVSAVVLLCSVWNAMPADVSAVSTFGTSHGSAGGGSYAPEFTSDGASLLFLSHARNLTTNDSGNGFLKIYSLSLSNNHIGLVDVRNGTSRANASLGNLVVSSNGQYMVFESLATNLAANDTNRSRDVFLSDLATGNTLLMSGNTNRTGSGNGDSYNPVVSANGNWAAFESKGRDLAEIDQGSVWNVYLYNRLSGITIAASHGRWSTLGNAYSPALTPDGTKMAFVSTALGLADDSSPGNGLGDVYIRHNQTGSIYWAGRGLATNMPGPYACLLPQISNNGQQVLFKVYSQQNRQTYVCFFDNSNYVNSVIATNANPSSIPVLSGNARLVASENNSNVFLWNLETGTNQLISANVAGTGPGNRPSYNPVVSRDFTRVAFLSEATDLTTNICNGKPQIFIRDLISGVTRLVTADTNRVGSGDFTGAEPVISPSGDLVAFDSTENNLAPDDRNEQSDIFLYAWTNDAVQLVTRAVPSKLNKTGRSISFAGPASVNANGRYVALSTLDTNVYPVPNTNAFNFLVWDTWQNRNLLLDIYTNPPSGGGSGFLQTAIGAKPPVISEAANKLLYMAQDYNYIGNPGVGSLYSLDLGTGSRTLLGQSRDPASSSVAYMNPAASADGRYVVFQSDASTLSSPILDTNSQSDVFIYDSVSGTTNLLSVSIQGTVGNGPSTSPSITRDGKWVFFKSDTSNLSTNFSYDWKKGRQLLYARELAAERTHIFADREGYIRTVGNPVLDSSNRVVFFDASLGASFAPVPFGVYGFDVLTRSNFFFATNSANPAITDDGRFLAYMKISSSSVSDVYVRDFQTGKEALVSAGFDGSGSSNGRCTNVLISPDARFIVFSSTASNLVPNDDNGVSDIFVRDRLLGITTLLSRNLQGTGPGSGASFQPVMSRDGRTVVFQSFAGDLAEGDYNNFRDVFVARLGGIDSDGDGMDDDWEVAYFGDLSRNGAGDFDGDGQSDKQEFLAGTNPKNNSSILRVMTVSGINSGVVTILWNAVPGKSYRVQYKDDLTVNGWTDLNGLVTATSSTGSKQDPQPSSQRFYRVLVSGE